MLVITWKSFSRKAFVFTQIEAALGVVTFVNVNSIWIWEIHAWFNTFLKILRLSSPSLLGHRGLLHQDLGWIDIVLLVVNQIDKNVALVEVELLNMADAVIYQRLILKHLALVFIISSCFRPFIHKLIGVAVYHLNWLRVVSSSWLSHLRRSPITVEFVQSVVDLVEFAVLVNFIKWLV